MNGLKPYLRLLRPHQWIKNGFVFAGVLFGHAWNDVLLVQQVVWAAIAFSLVASSVYVLNDLSDRERDRLHPEKRRRPLAAGVVNVPQALLLAGLCAVLGLVVAHAVSGRVLALVALYIALNMGYSQGLKNIVLLDVFIVSAGFMLRILAGTFGVGIEPSHWLLLCGLMITLFLGFAKRRAELNALAGQGRAHRRVLGDYDPALLDKLIGICAAGAIVSYSLYTVSEATIAAHGTNGLIVSVPFVIYGIFRYLFLLHRRGGGGDPAAALLSDPHLLVSFLGWLGVVVGALVF